MTYSRENGKWGRENETGLGEIVPPTPPSPQADISLKQQINSKNDHSGDGPRRTFHLSCQNSHLSKQNNQRRRGPSPPVPKPIGSQKTNRPNPGGKAPANSAATASPPISRPILWKRDRSTAPQQSPYTPSSILSEPHPMSPSRVERNAPRRVRPPPRQTVRAVFPHTAFHVELTLSLCAPFPHLIQSHCLPLVVIRLRVFQLVPPLACML